MEIILIGFEMNHITPRKGMKVQLVSTSEIERQNKGTSPVKVGSIGEIFNDPDEVGVFKVRFPNQNKISRASVGYRQDFVDIACIRSMVELVIDSKLEKKVTIVTTALVTKDLKKV